MRPKNRELPLLILMLLAMTAWGFAWPSGKIISSMAPRDVLVFWRFLVTLISFLPLMFGHWSKLMSNPRGVFMALLGALFYTVYSELFFLGLEHGMPGAGGVLVTTLNPIITAALHGLLYRVKPSARQRTGLIMGFIAGMVLLAIWKFSWQDLIASGNLYFLLAAVTWAFMTLTTQKSSSHMESAPYTLLVYFFSTLFVAVRAVPMDFLAPLSFSYIFWGNLFYLSVVSTTFGTTVYLYASSRLGSHRSSSFIFLVPVSALLGSYLFYGEIPTITTIGGGFIAILAVYSLNSGGNSKKTGESENLE